MKEIQEELVFDSRGLIPAVVQDANTRRVLMVAYMNRESLEKTKKEGQVHFWSRSRGELWHKGATSGNTMNVVRMVADCDRDCLLLEVQPAGPACHTGATSCFEAPDRPSLADVLGELKAVIRERKKKRPEGSYTAKLFDGGIDRITKKLGEEAVEVVIAGKNQDREELARESADLLYHLLVLWEQCDLAPEAVAAELQSRRR
jgi:phosphoribosyl-ATP pyrophosphohydrolase/phosphoribosyl-AMP cyclohydrolase